MATTMTPIGVLNFPTLFEARGNKANPSQEPRYSAMLLFDKAACQTSAYKDLQKAIQNCIADKWGEAKAADANFVKGLRSPLRDASEKTYSGFENGEIFLSAWSRGSDAAPGVLDLKGDNIIVPGDVFSGQLARFTVRPFAYDSNGNRGVSLGLEHVQVVKQDCERLDGRQSAAAAFGNGSDEQLAALGISPEQTAPSENLPF